MAQPPEVPTDGAPPGVVTVQLEGRTALVTIDRPDARNAVSKEVAEGLEAALDRIEADDEILTAVLTGSGSVFCAGADLGAFIEGRDTELFTRRGGFAGFVRYPRTKPVIAAVNGPAMAGGFELALACDLLVAVRTARFGLPEVKLSLIAGGGGLVHLPRLLAKQTALKILLTGDPIDAEEAHRLGLVTQLAEPGEAVTAALALAAAINANGPVAVRETLRLANASLDLDPEATWRASGQALYDIARTDDGREGPHSFLEKRPPNWTGH
ncbi:MAG: crotonase/enoyl-CoA hydratase family protein [Acidimicrobiia bacterium]